MLFLFETGLARFGGRLALINAIMGSIKLFKVVCDRGSIKLFKVDVWDTGSIKLFKADVCDTNCTSSSSSASLTFSSL